MTGKQIVNNLVEFFNAIRGTCAHSCCSGEKISDAEQWEKDKDLYEFNSSTLTDEYLELG